MAASSTPVDRFSLLASFRSRVASEDLGNLYERFDIPAAFTLSVPDENAPVFGHGADLAPLYLAHLEYGLRLPLPIMVRRICERLGVSPMQLAPNAIAIMMAFLVICHRVGVVPTLQLFSHLVGVKTSKKDAHFFFMNLGEKLVHFPESNKRWKEKFVWVFGADPILSCPTWPEIKKDGWKPLPLSDAERQDLDRVRSYAGSREINNLFDNSSLRVAGLSHVLPSDADKEKEAALAQAAPRPTRAPEASGSALGALPKPPLKRARKPMTAEEKDFLAKNVDMVAAVMAAESGPSAGPEKKKRKKKKTVAPKEAAGTVAAPEEAGGGTAARAEASALAEPLSEEMTLAASSPVGMPSMEDVLQSEGEAGRDLSGLGVPPLEENLVAAPTPEPVSGPRVEPAPTLEASTGTGPSSSWSEGPSSCSLPFPHRIADTGKERWKAMRLQLIGELEEWFAAREDSADVDLFVPADRLREDDSLLLSGRAQLTALHQIVLPRDMNFLREVPSRGLRLAAQSYHLRGALAAEEFAGRLEEMVRAHGELEGELARERRAKEEAVEGLKALEAERAEVDASRARESEAFQAAMSNLEVTLCSQAVEVRALAEEAAELRAIEETHRAEMLAQEGRLSLLEKELQVEKQARSSVETELAATRQSFDDARRELVHMGELVLEAQGQAKAFEGRLDFLSSEAGKKEVIDSYRQGPLGKVELAMAIKAGFDFLKARLPPTPPGLSFDVSYPSRVQDCLGVLQDLEARGGGIRLSSDEEDDDDEEDEDENEDGDDPQ